MNPNTWDPLFTSRGGGAPQEVSVSGTYAIDAKAGQYFALAPTAATDVQLPQLSTRGVAGGVMLYVEQVAGVGDITLQDAQGAALVPPVVMADGQVAVCQARNDGTWRVRRIATL